MLKIGRHVWIGTAGGINKTTDGGQSWVKFNHTNEASPISGNFVVALQQTDVSRDMQSCGLQLSTLTILMKNAA